MADRRRALTSVSATNVGEPQLFFEKLPREMRDRIYHYVLIPDDGEIVVIRRKCPNHIDHNQDVYNYDLNTLDYDVANDKRCRDCIYASNHFWHPPYDKRSSHQVHSKTPVNVSILRVSSRIHEEAFPVLYGHAKFRIDATEAIQGVGDRALASSILVRFLDLLPTKYKKSMRYLFVDIEDTWYREAMWFLVTECPNLQTLLSTRPDPMRAVVDIGSLCPPYRASSFKGNSVWFYQPNTEPPSNILQRLQAELETAIDAVVHWYAAKGEDISFSEARVKFTRLFKSKLLKECAYMTVEDVVVGMIKMGIE